MPGVNPTKENMPEGYMDPVFFEVENSCDESYVFRSEVLEGYKEFVMNTKEERAQWQQRGTKGIEAIEWEVEWTTLGAQCLECGVQGQNCWVQYEVWIRSDW